MSMKSQQNFKSGDFSPQPKMELAKSEEIQAYGTLTNLPVGLPKDVRLKSVEALNQLLADTITLRDMYKKHHWQVSGPTFYQTHLLFDEHYEKQAELVDTIAERIMSLGGIAIAMAPDVAELTNIPRAPKGREPLVMQITRLLQAHETMLEFCRSAAKKASENGDDGTNDLFVSDVIREHEKQVWFLSEHLVKIAPEATLS